MKSAFFICAVALGVAATPATAAGTELSVTGDYVNYSGVHGSRQIVTAESTTGIAADTKFGFGISSGERKVGDSRFHAIRLSGSVAHIWSDRLSSYTSVSLANHSAVFAKQLVAQDIGYKLTHGLVATVGARFASYGSRDKVTSWSGGAAYYLRGASLSYRFSLLDSNRLGRSTAHLASFSLKDSGGSGSTQLWVGHGTSLYEIVDLPGAAAGKFTSVAVRRVQPIGGGVAVNFGVNRSWFNTPTGNYRGTGVSVGLSLRKLRL